MQDSIVSELISLDVSTNGRLGILRSQLDVDGMQAAVCVTKNKVVLLRVWRPWRPQSFDNDVRIVRSTRRCKQCREVSQFLPVPRTGNIVGNAIRRCYGPLTGSQEKVGCGDGGRTVG